MKAVVAAFNQEKALVGAFSVITNIRMQLFEALVYYLPRVAAVLSGACQVHRVEPRPGPAPEHGDQDQTQRQL